MDIAERIFEEMKKKRITQSELASLLNITQSQVAHWKGRGSKVPSELLPQICEILDISPNYLLTGRKDIGTLTPTETLLLRCYRGSCRTDQAKLLKASSICASRERKEKGIDVNALKKIKIDKRF